MTRRPERSKPARRAPHVLAVLLRGYLALFLAGCAATRPTPTREEARQMETRILGTDDVQAFDAVVTALQDLSFSIDSAEPTTGLITAHRETETELAEISKDPAPGEKKGMPTWAKVAIVATGAIIVIAVVAALSSDDDHGAAKDEDRDHKDRHHHEDGHDTEVMVVSNDVHPSGPPIYHYQITVQLKEQSDSETSVRVSGQGTKSRGGSVEQAGPIHDAAFFDGFFAQVNGSLGTPLESAR
jgi:hypothetical protein